MTPALFFFRDPKTVIKRTANSAYPKVISNLGALMDTADGRVAVNMIRFMNHYARSVQERLYIIQFFKDNSYIEPRRFVYDRDTDSYEAEEVKGAEAFKEWPDGRGINTAPFMSMMNDYFAVGFANTIGYAHANTGDTMTSVMIGGLRTVMNGDFEIFPGDLVQFYWYAAPLCRAPPAPSRLQCLFPRRSFEKDDFLPNGRRKPYINIWDGNTPCNVDPSVTFDAATGVRGKKRDADGREVWPLRPDAATRGAHYNLSYGQKTDKQKIVAKIKPYFRDEQNPRLMDWFRVFGVAIASARPNEMCDIKISRQSM